MEGPKLIEILQHHVLRIMQQLAECQPGGPGATNKEIEEAAGLALNLPYQDGWLTWSILHSLLGKGLVEAVVIRHGKVTRHKYRLSSRLNSPGE
ncbi:hypothetical protein MOTE_18630 [Moorella thermoacetica]|uniref:Uncharacterized protein n=1 Tax=Neomoorella thermoacetica TaxID=1525 RepID=A0A1J5P3H4_NEOTH|nr:hypothetical protein MOTE_18630 [Moorella thermoacetica]